METEHGHSRKLLVCFYEFLGQIFFMYAVMVAGGSLSEYAGIVGPLALFAVVNIFGGVSGGHFNPAVTLGVYIREKKVSNCPFMLAIMGSQVAGALVGMFLAYFVLRNNENGEFIVPPQSVPLLLPSTITRESIDNNTFVLNESFVTVYMSVICTFIFVFFILHVTGKHTGAPDLGVWGVPAICLVLWGLI